VVVDRNGGPVSSYTVMAIPGQVAREEPDRRNLRIWGARYAGAVQVVNDPQGRFEFKKLRSDVYDVIAFVSSGASGELVGIAVAPGDEKRDLRIVVTPSAKVIGRIVNADTGAPIAGAQVTMQLPGVPEVISDSDGHFSIAEVPAGRPFSIFVFAGLESYVPDGWAYSEVPIRDGVRDLGDIHLLPGSLPSRPPTMASIGLKAENIDRTARVSEVTAGGPAMRSAVVPRESLTRVDGRNVAAFGGNAIQYLLRGAAGTMVEVAIGQRVITLKREN